MRIREKCVDIVFIGGGPATLGILTNAIRTDRLTELLSNDSIAILEKQSTFGGGYLSELSCNSNTAGDGFIRCILEKIDKPKNKNPTVTNGKLKLMTINKKTITVVKNSENKIISDSETKDDSEGNNDVANGHDSDNELDYNYDEAIDNSQPLKDEKGRDKIQSSKPLPMFKKLFTSEVCSALKRFGGSPAPLSLIGTFLSYVGNYVLQHIHEKYKKRVFYPF